MADFLLFLGKLNLAMGAAIILICLLRRPLRASFGAPVAYAIWLLVPIAGLSSLLPPRVTAPPPTPLTHLQNLAGQYPAAPMTVIRQIAHPALRITEQLTGQSALVHPVIATGAAASVYGMPDYALLLFAAWALGAVLMALYLARLQVRFHATMRLGEAGPAVLGFFRPRVVMPDTFEEQFTAAEQAAILAHERVHLARQDARINALAALLRSLCWFNPLIHLGAASMRIDQELACDATALAGPVSRRDYANALMKSQMMVTALPLGCNWPGSQHPLIERIALLKRKRPGTARRITGTGLVIVAAACAGLSAWAAQPAVPATFIAAPHQNNQIASAVPPAMTPASGQNAGGSGPNQPVADSNPISSGNHGDASKNVRASNPISAAPSEAPPQLLPKDAPATTAPLNAPPVAQSASPAAAVALNDQPAAQPTTPDSSAGPVQVTAAAPPSAGSDPVSSIEALSRGACVPTLGTVISVHGDSSSFGTDVVLDHVSTSPQANPWMRDNGTIIARIPADNVKSFSALDTYVGHKVAIWPIIGDFGNKTVLSIEMPLQLQLLSTALADPKKTWCYLSRIQREFASEASPAAPVTLNDQPVAPMQPATSVPSAAPVKVAAAAPASANSDSVSAMEALSRGECQPAAIGTVISVHTDPKLFGTDIVLDANDGQEWEGREWHGKEHAYVAFIPIGSVKNFPAFDTYVGQKVVIWTLFNNGGTRTDFDEITMPPRLQLLSAALSNPKKTWCYLPPGKNL